MPNRDRRINQSNRQRQKITRRTVLLIAGAFFIVMVAGIMVAINLTQVGKSKAGQSDGSTPVVIIEDQDFTVEKSIPALEIKIQTTKPGTLYFRKVKALPSTSAGVTSK